jgi:hypothetical protein
MNHGGSVTIHTDPLPASCTRLAARRNLGRQKRRSPTGGSGRAVSPLLPDPPAGLGERDGRRHPGRIWRQHRRFGWQGSRPDLGCRGSFYRKLVIGHDIDRFERGLIVEVRRLRREIGMSRAVLSRMLSSLERKELVFLYDATLEERHYFRPNGAVKFAGLSPEGKAAADALSANKVKDTKLAHKPDELIWLTWCPQ